MVTGGKYQPGHHSRQPKAEELDAEEHDGCLLCRAKPGEPCKYMFSYHGDEGKNRPHFLREFKQRYGQGRWVHAVRLDAREMRLARETKEQGQNA